MTENKFNYVVGIALVVLLVLVVYLGGRVKTIESSVDDLYGRVSDVESFLDVTTSPAAQELLAPEEELSMEEDLGAYSLGAFDDYYGGYADDYYYDYGY